MTFISTSEWKFVVKIFRCKIIFDPYDYHISTCYKILKSIGLKRDLLEYHILENMLKSLFTSNTMSSSSSRNVCSTTGGGPHLKKSVLAELTSSPWRSIHHITVIYKRTVEKKLCFNINHLYPKAYEMFKCILQKKRWKSCCKYLTETLTFPDIFLLSWL